MSVFKQRPSTCIRLQRDLLCLPSRPRSVGTEGLLETPLGSSKARSSCCTDRARKRFWNLRARHFSLPFDLQNSARGKYAEMCMWERNKNSTSCTSSFFLSTMSNLPLILAEFVFIRALAWCKNGIIWLSFSSFNLSNSPKVVIRHNCGISIWSESSHL